LELDIKIIALIALLTIQAHNIGKKIRGVYVAAIMAKYLAAAEGNSSADL